MNAGIRYRIYGGIKFYQRSEIKCALAYLRLIQNSDDNDAFRRIINYPARSIGKATLEKIERGAQENRCSLFAFIQTDSSFSKQDKFIDFVNLIQLCRKTVSEKEPPMELHEQALFIFEQSGLMASYEKKQEVERLQNLSELCNAMKQFSHLYQTHDLTQYLSVIALVHLILIVLLFSQAETFFSHKDTSNTQDGKLDTSDETERVQMMTIHGAKGLEFHYVFIPGLGNLPSRKNSVSFDHILSCSDLVQNLFPSNMFGTCDLEEERTYRTIVEH